MANYLMLTDASDDRATGEGDGPLPFEQLQANVGQEWPQISAARQCTKGVDAELREICGPFNEIPETGIVAFGSLARKEWTSGSDVDWAFLVDGQADPEHFRIEDQIAQAFSETKYAPPGSTGTFAAMASSHELIHHVGGLEDSNRNLTRRILMLLESTSLTDRVVHERVIRQILQRYIVCDPAVSSMEERPFRVPRFLLNDMVRFWRTMAVDYATKKWQQREKKWVLRNIKLRMSRKLLFVKGLLMCFDCELSPPADELPEGAEPQLVVQTLANRCFKLSRMTPLDLLSQVLSEHADNQTAVEILTPYDEFLGCLHDKEKREHLKELSFDDAREDDVFNELRTISHRFQEGLERLFFDQDEELFRLTRRYGVF